MNILSNLFQTGTGELGLTEFFVSVVFSLAVGIICMFLYRIYFRNTYDRNESLNKSFIIIAPSISAVFWAIQYSLPLSLGLLGALSFVRFRTPIKRSEDIGFILFVIALALLSSVYRFYAAGILLGVITVAIVAKASFMDRRLPFTYSIPFLNTGTSLTAFVSTKSGKIENVDDKIRKALIQKFSDIKEPNLTLYDIVQREPGYNLRYTVHFKEYYDTTISRIISTLNTIEELERVEVFHGKVS
jgi:hypothetical protein